jgi:naphthoate synthase
MTDFTDITYETDANIAEVTLNRPEKRNAIRPQMLRDLDAARAAAEDDDDIGALLISAPDEAVSCAGAGLEAVIQYTDDQAGLETFSQTVAPSVRRARRCVGLGRRKRRWAGAGWRI